MYVCGQPNRENSFSGETDLKVKIMRVWSVRRQPTVTVSFCSIPKSNQFCGGSCGGTSSSRFDTFPVGFGLSRESDPTHHNPGSQLVAYAWFRLRPVPGWPSEPSDELGLEKNQTGRMVAIEPIKPLLFRPTNQFRLIRTRRNFRNRVIYNSCTWNSRNEHANTARHPGGR